MIQKALTRMGKSAKFIITGDVTQIDLPKNQSSGLVIAQNILQKTSGISFVKLDEKDVIRHQLVKKIIKAFQRHFRQDLINGILDQECLKISLNLAKKVKNT